MGRFSMNIRPMYGADEETGAERFSRGVGGAIDTYLQQHQAKQAQAERDRQERNQYTSQGYEAVPPMNPDIQTPGVERPGGPVRLGGKNSAGRPNISGAIDTVMQGAAGSVFPAANAGYDVARTRDGQMFRRPGAQMRQRQEDERELGMAREKERIRVAGEKELIPLRNAKPRSGMTQGERIQLEQMRQQGRLAIQALISGRGNSAMQLQAAKAVQSSLDGHVRTLQQELATARRSYDDERVQSLLEQLEEARSAAEEHRSSLSGITERPAAPSRKPEPGRRTPSERRAAPGPRPPRTATPPTGRRTVPPPVRP